MDISQVFGPDDAFADDALGSLTKADLVGLVRQMRLFYGERIAALEAEVARLVREAGRDSTNSGLPPSGDKTESRRKRVRSQRQQTGRKPGKQPGMPGSTLARRPVPDRTETYIPESCTECGEGLGDAEVVDTQTRQVLDVPAPRVEATDHVAQTRRCRCGHDTTAAFPPQATAPTCWGPHVRSIAIYLVVGQHVPYLRTAEILREAFGVELSAGTIVNWVRDCADRLETFEATLLVLLATAGVIHVDETGCRVRKGADRHYVHVVSTLLLTLLIVHKHRGREAMRDVGVLPGFSGVAVHDRYARYWDFDCDHAICNVHILRDLASVAEIATQQAWATGMADLLREANKACWVARAAAPDGSPAELDIGLRRSIKIRYGRYVQAGLRANPDPQHRKRNSLEREAYNLAAALDTHRHETLRFIDDLTVGFSNNQAERDCRPVKLHQKISGLWRTFDQATRWLRTRSYISTLRKNDQPVLAGIRATLNGTPWQPTTAW